MAGLLSRRALGLAYASDTGYDLYYSKFTPCLVSPFTGFAAGRSEKPFAAFATASVAAVVAELASALAAAAVAAEAVVHASSAADTG